MNLHSQISLDNFVLNVSRASGEGISFNQGEIVKGQVQDVKGNGLVSILIKGRLIEAATEVMVNKGQQLFLMVDDMKDGKVFLRVLTPELLSKIENTNIATNLREIGIPSNPENLQMAKKLIQHNLPVTNDMIKNMARALNLLGGSSPRNLEIVGMAMAKNVPLTPQALAALAQFVEGKPDLASMARDLMRVISRLNQMPEINRPQTTVNMPPTPVVNQEQAGPTRNIPNIQVPGENIREGQAMPTTRDMVTSEIARANVTNPTGSPQTQVTPTPAATANVASSATSPSIALTNILPLLNSLLENMVIPLDKEDSARQLHNIVQALQNNITNDKEFIRNLVLIKDILQKQEFPEVNKVLINTLVKGIEEMEREFTGQRIFNVMTKFTGDSNLNYYYLSFPVKVDDEYRLCQLKIDKKLSGKTLMDQDNVKIVVSLETGNLGLVLFHVDWYKKGLIKLQGVVETEAISNHIGTHINSLLKALEAKGYTIDYQGIKVANPAAEQMRVELQEVDEVLKPYVIDIRI